MADDRDFTSYVVARWTRLVRCLVSVGAPLDLAHRVAADTLSSCHDDWASRDDWSDLDGHVVGELLDRWDRQPGAWWQRPARPSDGAALDAAGWPEVEVELDRMPVPERRALVLREVAGLSHGQVRELTGVERPGADSAVITALLEALDLVPVEDPPVEAMVAASERRRRRRRAVSLVGGVALLVFAGTVTAIVLRQPDPTGRDDVETFAPVRSIPYDNPSPLAWYGDGTLYLPHSQVSVRDVHEFAQWDDGAVYLDLRGNLVTVTGDGERERIATPGPGSTFAVSDSANVVAWVDPDGPQLVLHDLDTGERRLERTLDSDDARIVGVEDQTALVSLGEDLLTVDLTDGSVEPTVDRRLPGELDRHGRYVLTQEAGGGLLSRIRLYDASTERLLPVTLGDTRSVTAARFGPDGSVMLLIEQPGAGSSEVRRCPPPYDVCRLVAYYPPGGARSVLAQ